MAELRTSEVLNLAADYIELNGWKQGGGWWPESGEPACAEGGIDRVCSDRMPKDDEWLTRKRLAVAALSEYVGQYGWYWNDTPGLRQSDVIETLRAVAVVEAAREDAALLSEMGSA